MGPLKRTVRTLASWRNRPNLRANGENGVRIGKGGTAVNHRLLVYAYRGRKR